MRLSKTRIAVAALALSQAACALPNVDRDAPGFSEVAYRLQLAECHVTTAGAYTWRGAVGALLGAGVGASHGAIGGGEGAAIGAAVGAVIGTGVGAALAVKEETASVEGCVKEKGYSVTPG